LHDQGTVVSKADGNAAHRSRIPWWLRSVAAIHLIIAAVGIDVGIENGCSGCRHRRRLDND
jgi:hypothetical protein